MASAATRYSFEKGFPTRENCNLDDPREMFLWTLVALPGVRGAQLIMPVGYNMTISEHLHKCGARLAADPVIKYQAPTASEPHWMTSPGKWVSVDTADVAPHPARAALGKLTALQKAELLEALLEERDER